MDGPDLTPDLTLARPWGRLSYSDNHGPGKVVLFLHGHGGNRHDFDPLLPLLKGIRAIRIDFQGHGGSSVPRNVGLLDLMRDAMALLAHLWVGKVEVVGHSLGGMVALEMLRHHPDRIHQLVLLEGWTALRYIPVLTDDILEMLEPRQRRELEQNRRQTLVRWVPAVRDDFWFTVEDFDALELLRTTSHRILSLYGDRNRDCPRQEDLGLPRRANLLISWIKNAGHYLHLSHPEQVGRQIRDFLMPEEEPEGPPLPPADLDDLLWQNH